MSGFRVGSAVGCREPRVAHAERYKSLGGRIAFYVGNAPFAKRQVLVVQLDSRSMPGQLVDNGWVEETLCQLLMCPVRQRWPDRTGTDGLNAFRVR